MKNNFFDYMTNVLMVLAALYFIPVVLESIYGSWNSFLNMKNQTLNHNIRVLSSSDFNQQIDNFLKDPEVKIIVVKKNDNVAD